MAGDLVGRKMAISVLFDTVSIEINCGDDYAAQVLYDDIIERTAAGQRLTFTIEPNEKKAAPADG